ncbi:sugar phosphate nucleotidyltransferase [Legionella pneumophila]|nr:sugar phosphate nucleotidyltransferase [Legionella pneumophila]
MTFGIKPDSPKTGYGYIEAGTTLSSDIKQVLSFREKPDAHTAAQFVSKGNYFWNSGMFICRAGVYLEELEQFEANIYQFSQQALTLAQHHHDFLRLDLDCFSQCKEESIDYAIMEKTDKAVVIPISIQWSDWAAGPLWPTRTNKTNKAILSLEMSSPRIVTIASLIVKSC